MKDNCYASVIQLLTFQIQDSAALIYSSLCRQFFYSPNLSQYKGQLYHLNRQDAGQSPKKIIMNIMYYFCSEEANVTEMFKTELKNHFKQ